MNRRGKATTAQILGERTGRNRELTADEAIIFEQRAKKTADARKSMASAFCFLSNIGQPVQREEGGSHA